MNTPRAVDRPHQHRPRTRIIRRIRVTLRLMARKLLRNEPAETDSSGTPKTNRTRGLQ